MADLEARFDTTQLERAATHAAPVIFRGLHGATTGILTAFQSRHLKERMSGRPGVMRKTAQLARSWKVIVTGTTVEDLRGTYATTSRYARMQEFGGVQRPRNAKMLAIPLSGALTPTGIGRFNGSLRAVLPAAFPGGTFVARSKSGNLILFGKTDKDADPIALFVLKSQVTIPPRLGTRDLWKANQPEAQRILNVHVSRANVELAKIAQGGGS